MKIWENCWDGTSLLGDGLQMLSLKTMLIWLYIVWWKYTGDIQRRLAAFCWDCVHSVHCVQHTYSRTSNCCPVAVVVAATHTKCCPKSDDVCYFYCISITFIVWTALNVFGQFLVKVIFIVCHQMSYFKARMHQIGSVPQTMQGELTVPIMTSTGPTSKGRQGRGRGKKVSTQSTHDCRHLWLCQIGCGKFQPVARGCTD